MHPLTETNYVSDGYFNSDKVRNFVNLRLCKFISKEIGKQLIEKLVDKRNNKRK